MEAIFFAPQFPASFYSKTLRAGARFDGVLMS
ncbi:hypothetical protein DFR44_101144 [Hydromonas duriensis]|uniref:Uncharacterized protein n=1 Tax=Hydromonas duriensis TaxID=1527608 RepID=A0A4R6YBW6_9BURK|nr:hypothetical protein DFR44_101144 [Hydromonas duriensis]